MCVVVHSIEVKLVPMYLLDPYLKSYEIIL